MQTFELNPRGFNPILTGHLDPNAGYTLQSWAEVFLAAPWSPKSEILRVLLGLPPPGELTPLLATGSPGTDRRQQESPAGGWAFLSLEEAPY